MVGSLREHVRARVAATFPERQIYIRSAGRVQFFAISPPSQAIAAGAALLALGWVLFTSANTLFEDQILAMRERSFRQIQASYEARIAHLQISHDRLSDALGDAETRFDALARDLEARHRTLAQLVGRRHALRSSLGIADAAPVPPPERILDADPAHGIGGSATETLPGAAEAPAAHLPAGAAGRPQDVTKQTSAPELPAAPGGPRAFIDSAIETFASLFQRAASSTEERQEKSLHALVALETRLAGLRPAQHELLGAAADALDRDARLYNDAIRSAGIDPRRLVTRVERERGASGGPELPLSATDADFDEDASRLAGSLESLSVVATALRAVPLTQPVAGAEYEQTSGFGVRRDPFTKRQAFHAGLDFSGPSGSAVQVTAPGVVTFAGPKGAYGNTVEVDHGFGIRTRYGHLSRILVPVGSTLEKGAVVGTLGSTGRSTGPHVHYEIWYEDAVKNPSRFLRAGIHVLQD